MENGCTNLQHHTYELKIINRGELCALYGKNLEKTCQSSGKAQWSQWTEITPVSRALPQPCTALWQQLFKQRDVFLQTKHGSLYKVILKRRAWSEPSDILIFKKSNDVSQYYRTMIHMPSLKGNMYNTFDKKIATTLTELYFWDSLFIKNSWKNLFHF